jgi:uncharacterized protein (TIGR02246 family)
MITGDDRASIGALHDRWLAAELRGDSRALLEFCTTGPVWLPPQGAPLAGREAILAWLDAQPSSVVRRIEIEDLRVAALGPLAWKAARFRTTFESPPGSGPRVVTGAHAWLLHRHDASGWKVAAVAWTIDGTAGW